MKIAAKILSFDPSDGKGILITSQKEKLVFDSGVWDDVDVMPSLGLEVECFYEAGEIQKIVVSKNSDFTCEQINFQTTLAENQTQLSDFDIDIIADEEIPPREESISISMNLPKAVNNYFNLIRQNIDKREAYRRVDGRLNYLMVRRFLWTAFNNVSELDEFIITPKVKALSQDLKAMTRIYDDFMRKIKHPPLAYEEVFLSCQSEYLKIRDAAQMTIDKLNTLKNNEKCIGEVLKIRKDELSANIKSDEFDALQDDFKSLNGAYVDIVHMMAELDERYKHDMKLLVDFEKEYREDFYKIFQTTALEYKREIIEILSAQAYVLDTELWQRAKSSKAIQTHFEKAGIKGSLNTKTYLKYYLDSLDNTKMTEDARKLFELYEYLSTLYKECILVVVSSANDAIEYEQSLKYAYKEYEVKAFIDENAALKWAMKHSVKVLVLQDRLAKTHTELFLQSYKRNVLLAPKIIIIGNSVKSSEYSIAKLLGANVSARLLSQNVKELL